MSFLAMNGLYSSNHKKKKTEPIKFMENNMVEARFWNWYRYSEPNIAYYGDGFSKGNIKII